MNLLKNEKILCFAGGVIATLVGAHAVKSGKARKLAVKGLAAGMVLQKQAYEGFQNIKEEAADLCLEAAKEATKEDGQ
ncbi:MAG: DUF1490 domain-containing protein [Defluviitaleaceae bacterium]|nr:DUF1490 domain-containing protein [Defluviitaleaceae bacterium]